MTTTIGIVCGDGIVLASDSKATMGHFIASIEAKKIYQIDDFIGMTLAGSVGDAQKLIKILSIESKLYRIQRGESITIKGATNLLSNILNNNRREPYSIQFIIGGIDKNGIHLYSLDALGGMLEERKVCSTGSGSPMAYGILENEYQEGISIKDGIKVATNALNAAIRRDAASGGNIEIVTITEKGYVNYDQS